jgi:threonyl-tRNA synthetase
MIMPASDRRITESRFRAEADYRSEKIGYKIREGQMQKVPYQLIIGDKESEEQGVAVRHRKEGDKGFMSLSDFILLLDEEVKTRSL